MVFATGLLAGTLAPALAVMRDAMAISRETTSRSLMANYAVQKLEEQIALGMGAWTNDTDANSFAIDGHPEIAFNSVRSDDAANGGITGSLMHLEVTRNFDITTVALFLQNAKDSRLLADPNVTVVENELAEWKSVSEIPFQQITQSELGGQIGTTAFKEVGITLKVQAAIASDGTIEMEVESEFSRVAGFTENENQPIVDTRSATTVVRVANRQTLVIGGLRQRSDTGEFNGIPYLKDVKYLGPLFRSRTTNVRESELIVFIMPEVVGYDEPPAPREQVARETIGCRLARVPVAEGCPTQPCAAPVSDRLLQQSYIEGENYLQSLPTTTQLQPTGQPGRPPFRSGFDARYRSSGDTNVQPQRVQKTARKPRKAEAKATLMNQLFGS